MYCVVCSFVTTYRLQEIIATPPKLLPAITQKYQGNRTAIRTMSLIMLEYFYWILLVVHNISKIGIVFVSGVKGAQ